MVVGKTRSSRPIGGKKEVDAFLVKLEHPLKDEIKAIRTLILGADKRIRESIKWNAPSFSIEDHFATLNLRPIDSVQVVLHTGAKAKSNSRTLAVKDPAGLVKWAAKDRGVVTFSSMDDVRSQKAAFVAILRQWIQQL